MKKWIFLVCLLAIISIVAGCREKRESGVLHESATVRELIFTPEQHGSGIGVGYNTGKGGGGVVSPIVIDVKATYGVLFQCRHGNFVVQGDDEFHENLWKRMRKGERVIVSYKETYWVSSDYGKETRTHDDYHFIDAKEDK